jgi:hypothetical protein
VGRAAFKNSKLCFSPVSAHKLSALARNFSDVTGLEGRRNIGADLAGKILAGRITMAGIISWIRVKL